MKTNEYASLQFLEQQFQPFLLQISYQDGKMCYTPFQCLHQNPQAVFQYKTKEPELQRCCSPNLHRQPFPDLQLLRPYHRPRS